jgi:hypothetical protein
VKPARAKCGYLISVLPPGSYRLQVYAAGADNPIHALTLVSEYCSIANAKIELARELGGDDIDRLSKGGTSISAKNVRLLCMKHNLQKSGKIE